MESDYKSFLDKKLFAQNKRFYASSISALLQERAACVDNIVKSLWHKCALDNTHCALYAVGGYGRKTLHPYSDIDIAIFIPEHGTIPEAKLNKFVTALWDLGLDIGHSVRTLSETYRLSKEDITVATSLLDLRHLDGDLSLGDKVKAHLSNNAIISERDFFQGKMEEQQARHRNALNTALYLEPNLKANPGGMRDFHTILWIANKHFNLPTSDLIDSVDFLQEDEKIELLESHDFICRVRWALHCVAKRPQETLTFEYQAEVASFLKFGEGEFATQAIERMMRQLFRAMTRVQEFNQIVCDEFSNRILNPLPAKVQEIDKHFRLVNGLIDTSCATVFLDKSQVIQLFIHLAKTDHAKGISHDTLRLLRKIRCRLLGELQDYHACREKFIELFEQPKNLNKVLGLMHRYGILGLYDSKWAQIEGRMQFDIQNAYTVDEHVLKTTVYLSEFANATTEPKSYEIGFARVQNKLALMIAGFCHHLAGSQEAQSNAISAMLAREFATFHNLKKSTCDLIHWLVENQTLLIDASRTLDIYDIDTIKSLNRQLKSIEHLNALYALTVADIMATNNSAWNNWQATSLEHLYSASREVFKHSGSNIFEQRNVIRETKAEALNILTNCNVKPEAVTQLWKTLPKRLFSTSTVTELVSISQTILNADAFPIVFFTPNTDTGYSTLVVYSANRKKLFVDIFNTLTRKKVNVKSAELLETKENRIIEVFKLLDANNQPLSDRYRIEQITKEVKQTLLKGPRTKKLPSLRKIEHFDSEPSVEFIASQRKERSLLKIKTLNKPIYIEKICAVFREFSVSVHSAKVTTLGESLESAFLLADAKGNSLESGLKEKLTNAFQTSFN